MKILKTIIAATMICFFFATVSAQTKTALQKIEIKTSAVCEMCEGRIKKALKKTEGVQKINMDIDKNIVTVLYDSSVTNPDKIRKAITMAGYNAAICGITSTVAIS